MKRISDEQITKKVKQFLNQRNYSEMKTNKIKAKNTKSISIKDLSVKLVSSQSNTNTISLSSSVNDFNSNAENAFKHFVNYITNITSQPIRQQMSKFIFPSFVHIFIELIECGHKISARRFIREHKSKFQDLTQMQSIIDSMNNTLNTSSIDTNLLNFKSSKYFVQISDQCFQQMNDYFEQINDLVIVQIMNKYVDINFYSNDNHIECENSERVVSSSPHKSSPFDEMEFISPNIKTFQTNTSNNEKQLLMNCIEKVRNCDSSVPSICLMTINSPDMSCVSATDDMTYVGAGFENSNICLWNLWSNQRSQIPIDVKRISSRIELNIIDHNINDEQSIDQTLSNDSIVNDLSAEHNLRVLRGHSGPVYGLAFIRKSNILLSCSCDTTVRAWDTITCNNVAIFNAHLWPIWSIDSCFFSDYFITGCKDGVACLWTTERLFPLRKFCGHNMDVHCVKFHPNCSLIATASGDKQIKLWDIQQTRVVRTFTGHQASIYCLSFSSCGKYMASAGEDRKVKLWDIASGNLMNEFSGHSDAVYSLTFNNNNTILSSCGSDQSLRLWNINKTVNSLSKSSVLDLINENNNSKNSNDSELLVSYQIEPNGGLIYNHFMPHNFLLTVGSKK